jgi:hypothetical protein
MIQVRHPPGPPMTLSNMRLLGVPPTQGRCKPERENAKIEPITGSFT